VQNCMAVGKVVDQTRQVHGSPWDRARPQLPFGASVSPTVNVQNNLTTSQGGVVIAEFSPCC